jgi:hypothetical protein
MKQALNLAIKIFGLYFFVEFFQYFMELALVLIGSQLEGGETNGYQGIELYFWYFGYIARALVSLIVFCFAIFRTEWIANKILGRDEPIKLLENKLDLLEVTLVVIGILAILSALPELLYQLVNLIYFHNHAESPYWTSSKQGTIFRYIFQLGLGFFVVMNARNFAKKLQRIGVKDDNLDNENKR